MEYGYHRENTGKRQQFFKIPNENPNKKQIRIKSLLRVSPIEDLIFKYELQGSKSISTLNVIYKEGGVCH